MPANLDRAPELVADLTLYSTGRGGRTHPIRDGYGCPCYPSGDRSAGGWDARVLLGDEPMFPGQSRRVGFVFLSGSKAAELMRSAGRFYLWEWKDIGEAVVVD